MDAIRLSLLGLTLTVAAFGQTSQTFSVTGVSSDAEVRGIATGIRTMAFDPKGTAQVMADVAKRVITVEGTAAELAVAGWMVQQFDTTTTSSAPRDYAMPGSDDDTLRILYLQHVPQQANLNEMVTVLRTVCDIQRIFSYTAQNAIMLRTTAGKADLAEWLVGQLDSEPKGGAFHVRYPKNFPAGPRFPKLNDQLVEVTFLPGVRDNRILNEAITMTRVVVDVQAIFSGSEANAIAFRADPDRVAATEWLMQQMAAPPAGQKAEYSIPEIADGAVRLYAWKKDDAGAFLQAVRTQAGLRQIFYSENHGVLGLRGTPDAVAIADKMVAESR